MCFAAFSPRLRRACSSRSRFASTESPLGDLDVDGDAGVRLELGRHVPQERRELDGLDARLLLPRVRPRERQHRAREPREPARLALDMPEEAVALDGILLRARLEHLDRADDRRQRRAQLVRGVRDELPLGELPPLLLGQVVDDEQRPVRLGLGRDPGDPVGVLLVRRHVHLRHGRPLVEEALGELAQPEALPRVRQRVPFASLPPSSRRASAFAKWTTRSWSIVSTPSCSRSSSSCSRSRSASRRRNERRSWRRIRSKLWASSAELVAEPVVERGLEVAVRDRLGGRAQTTQPQRDQLREQEPDDDADHAGDHARPERLAVDGVDRRRNVRPLADRDERPAPVGDRGHERPAVRRSPDRLAPASAEPTASRTIFSDAVRRRRPGRREARRSAACRTRARLAGGALSARRPRLERDVLARDGGTRARSGPRTARPRSPSRWRRPRQRRPRATSALRWTV